MEGIPFLAGFILGAVGIALVVAVAVGMGGTEAGSTDSTVADLDTYGGTVYLDTVRGAASSAPTYNYVTVPAEATVSLQGGFLRLTGVTFNYDSTVRDLAVELGSVQYIRINGGA